MPNRWEHDIQTCTQREINEYCVHDVEWQKFRKSMKGKSTAVKLQMLYEWRMQHRGSWSGEVPRRTQVQIDNYINALKRGGQLDLKGHIVR